MWKQPYINFFRNRLINPNLKKYMHVASLAVPQEVEKDYGAKLKKKWVATSDPRTRDAHSLMNTKEPIDMNEKFLVGGTRMKHTGDPDGGPANNINCRCVIIYVDEQDVVQD